jgi:hypothetical protein
MNARSTLSTPSGNEGSRRGYSCKNNGGGGAEDEADEGEDILSHWRLCVSACSLLTAASVCPE